jgi:hypothetical protein
VTLRSSAAQIPIVNQGLVSPAAVVVCASIRKRLAAAVSAFHEATKRLNPNPGLMVGEVHVPETSPEGNESCSPSRAAPLKIPPPNAVAEANRVS